MNLTDKEILDFVRENLTLDKNESGNFEIKEVLCPIHGHIFGDVKGDVRGNVCGDVCGNVVWDVYGKVLGKVHG